MNRLQRIACVIAFACAAAGARAAVPTPIESESRAARAVLTAVLLRDEVQNLEYRFLQSSRDPIDRVLRQFAAATSYAALVASPDGITLACAVSGTVKAQVTNAWLGVIKFEWQDCVPEHRSLIHTFNGPAEVTMLANTLAPTRVVSIRLGDRQRDLVENVRPGPSLPPDAGVRETIYRNMRLTGLLPLVREDVSSWFPGRYAFEVAGYYRFVQQQQDRPGDPELYDIDHMVSTDGALLSVEATSLGSTHHTDFRLLLGKFTERLETPSMPSSPDPGTFQRSMRGVDLRVQYSFGEKTHLIVDGKLESDMNVWYGFNCATPDVFHYRTRTPITYADMGQVFSAGELGINGNTTAHFTTTGSEPYVDLRGHVTLDVRGVGVFEHDMVDNIYVYDLFKIAPCAP